MEEDIYDFIVFNIHKGQDGTEHNSIDLYRQNKVIKHIPFHISYEHGYKFIDTFGEKDLGELLTNLIISDIEIDVNIDNGYTPEYKIPNKISKSKVVIPGD